MEKELAYYEQLELTLFTPDNGAEVRTVDFAKDVSLLLEEWSRRIDPLGEMDPLHPDNLELEKAVKLYYIIKQQPDRGARFYYIKQFENNLNYFEFINGYRIMLTLVKTVSPYYSYNVSGFWLKDNYYKDLTELSNAIFYNDNYFDLKFYDAYEICKNLPGYQHEMDCVTEEFKKDIKFVCGDFIGEYTLNEIEIDYINLETDEITFKFKDTLNNCESTEIVDNYYYDNY